MTEGGNMKGGDKCWTIEKEQGNMLYAANDQPILSDTEPNILLWNIAEGKTRVKMDVQTIDE